ncbi:MAG: hypothetical protein ACR2OA_19000 [Rubripirellula sp.]
MKLRRDFILKIAIAWNPWTDAPCEGHGNGERTQQTGDTVNKEHEFCFASTGLKQPAEVQSSIPPRTTCFLVNRQMNLQDPANLAESSLTL